MKSNLIILFFLFYSINIFSQCFKIESILVDACGTQEGLNEMVRFKVGSSAVNTNNLDVSWPNNNWQGVIKNNITKKIVEDLNKNIADAGGCGKLIEPINGVIPANATVILVTSFNFDITQNPFGAITDDIYIVFQDNDTITSGHFANYGTGIRNLIIYFGSSCSDSVSYDRSLLINSSGNKGAGDGATVNFLNNGNISYTNTGCAAPLPVFSVSTNIKTIEVCKTQNTVNLNGIAEGYDKIKWSATNGIFSDDTKLSTNYTISPLDYGKTITITLTATNKCGKTISDFLTLKINEITIPDFNTAITICKGTLAPVLNSTSPNGIVGVWNPSIVDNTVSKDYIFTPNAGQCAANVTFKASITNEIVPDFNTAITICKGASAPVLNATSPNGIVGVWNPSIVDNTVSKDYIFTPNAGQCAINVTFKVSVANETIPDFNTAITICKGDLAPVLNSTSPNGIVGVWNPSIVDNTVSKDYIFTPNAGQCATNVTFKVSVTNEIVPDFNTAITICKGASAPVLNSTSPNGIVGVWNPSIVDNTVSKDYIFTPNAGQCATNVTFKVTINEVITPEFSTINPICEGTIISDLPSISINGISGNWFPKIDNTSTTEYTFTPTNLSCTSTIKLTIEIIKKPEVILTSGCNGTDYEINATTKNTNTLKWYDESNNYISNDKNLIINNIGLYKIIVSDSNCENTSTIQINEVYCDIPKGISPNDDEKNNFFDLSNLHVKNLQIFNRYGMEVYSKSNYKKEWKGQNNNENELPDGTYYYIIQFESGKTKTGWVYKNSAK